MDERETSPRESWLRPYFRASDIRERLTSRYHNSVVRRTVILAGLGLPTFGANFLIPYLTADLLSAENFSLFYVATAVVNVLFSGSFVLNLFLTRYLVVVERGQGASGLYSAMRRINRVAAIWGWVTTAGIFAALLVVAERFGVRSHAVVLLIVLDAYSAYLADLARIMLASMRRTAALGAYTLVWTVLRLVLCLFGIAVSGTVWAAMLGIVAAAVVMHLGFRIWLSRVEPRKEPTVPSLPSPIALLPLLLGYGLLIAVSNLDVLLSYFLFVENDLAAYSASSVFPKTLLLVTVPLLQMLFAIMAGEHPSATGRRKIVQKSVATVLAMTAAGAAFVWLFSASFCGGAWGIKLCQPYALGILLLSILPQAVLRVLVVSHFARGRDWLAVSLVVPSTFYVAVVWLSHPRVDMMAQQFAIFSMVSLIFYAALQWASAQGALRGALPVGRRDAARDL